MKILKKILWFLLFAFIVIQFIRPKKNKSTEITANHIYSMYPASQEVKTIMGKACNDCHSNNSNYPWYSNIQPVYWWLNSHIQDGKRHMNFSEFGTYRIAKQNHKLEECIDEVKGGSMPLDSYTWTHTDAKLTDMEKAQLTAWWSSIMDSLKAKYPADSLVMPKRK
jgi:hypothetical protein